MKYMGVNVEKLKKLRKEKGVIQSVAASGSGLCIKTIYRYEHDRVKRYEMKTIDKLAEYYGVDASYFWENKKEDVK